MDNIEKLKEFTEELFKHYFTSLKEVGNRPYHVSVSTVTPFEKFKELKRKKEVKESINQASTLLASFSTEHMAHIQTFWEYVEELKIQEVEAKKVLDTEFVKFQNRAWQIIKMLKRRAEDRLDEFEEFEINDEPDIKRQLETIRDLTYDMLRDSWITKENLIDDVEED